MPKSNLELRIDQLDAACAARDEDMRATLSEILEKLHDVAEAVGVPGAESSENEGLADVENSEPETLRTPTETVAAPKAAAAAKQAKTTTGDTPPLDLGE